MRNPTLFIALLVALTFCPIAKGFSYEATGKLELPSEIGRVEAPQGFTPATWEEYTLLYKDRTCVLLNRHNLPYPFGSFEVRIDCSGTGHIQSHCFMSSLYQRPEPEYDGKGNRFPKSSPYDGLFSDWRVRTSFLKQGKGWTRLSLQDAIDLWGEPQVHSATGKLFYTFDAHGKHNSEENIYHLDLRFDDKQLIEAYRIRGIGITSPCWVTQGSTVQVPKNVE